MNDAGKHLDEAALDRVARAYAAAEFRETPPAEVDNSILDRAVRESQRRTLRFAFKPAYVAWAAVLALSLSVVLELALRTPQVPTTGVESSRRAEDSSAAAPPEAREAPVSDATSGGAGDDAVRTFASDADPDAAQLRAQEDDADARRTATAASTARTAAARRDGTTEGAAGTAAQRAAEGPGDFGAAARAPAGANRTLTQPPAAIGCAERDRATPEDWLACIEALNSDAADTIFVAELAAFRERHPDHVVPPELVRGGR